MTKELKKLMDGIEARAKERGWTIAQLAVELGFSENYIYRIKDGSRSIGLKFLTAVRRVFPSLKVLIGEYEESLAK